MAKKEKKAKRFKTKRDKMVDYLFENENTCTDDIYLVDKYFEDNGLDLEKHLGIAEKKLIHIVKNRKRHMIRITMFENPDATARGRHVNGIVRSLGAKESKERFRKYAKDFLNNLNKLINTTCRVRGLFYLPMPKGLKPWEVILHQANVLEPGTKPDWDNGGKYYGDLMNDVIYLDDDLVCAAEVVKFYNLRPRVVIELSYLDKHESIYLYNKIRTRKAIKELLKTGQATVEYMEGL